MAATHNFRSALSGFNREDVVHYIEYLNTKHNSALNQLKSENQNLTDELNALREKPDLTEECAQLQEENSTLKAQLDEMAAQVADLTAQLEQAQQVVPLADSELEAYRRAEKAERTAKERARQIYCQATGALADATTQVDEAAEQFKLLSQRITTHLADMQATVDRSKNALLGAAATMYTIAPENNENQ